VAPPLPAADVATGSGVVPAGSGGSQWGAKWCRGTTVRAGRRQRLPWPARMAPAAACPRVDGDDAVWCAGDAAVVGTVVTTVVAAGSHQLCLFQAAIGFMVSCATGLVLDWTTPSVSCPFWRRRKSQLG
jgi:hypothetical protein